MVTTTHTCETPNCGRPAPTTTICTTCTQDAQEWLDHIGKDELNHLAMIAYGQAQPATNNRVKHSSTIPADALNITAWQTWQNILNYKTLMPHLPKHPNAVRISNHIYNDVTTALRLTHGEEEQAINSDYVQARMAEIFPMPTPKIRVFFKQYFDMNISRKRIFDLKRYGKLKPRFTTTDGDNYYHPADVLRAIDNDRRKTTMIE